MHARHGVSQAEFTADLLAVAETGPELVIDDGLELTRRMAEHRPDLYARLQGVSEETTTGVARLRALEAEGRLPLPGDRRERRALQAHVRQPVRHRPDNADRAARADQRARCRPRVLHRRLRLGRQGLARAADGLGGRVTVVELDPVRALTAHMDGFRVASLANALPDADVVLTATGLIEAVGADAFAYLKDGVLLANAGHHDREIDVPALAAERGRGDRRAPEASRPTCSASGA